MKYIAKLLLLFAATLGFSSADAETITVWKNGEKILSIDAYYVDSIGFRELAPAAEEIEGAVDLGLSVKWASCNLGASKPDSYGSYFQWGDIVKRIYDEDGCSKDNYKWYKDGDYTKYCTNSIYWGGEGEMDNKFTLDPEDDAATVILGDNWRIPTREEWKELREKCTWNWTSSNGINGYMVTGPSGESIFLPAAGWIYGFSLYQRGSYGQYWGADIYEKQRTDQAFVNCFNENSTSDWNSCERYYGSTIRPVTTATASTATQSDESGSMATCVWSKGENLLASIATEVDSISFSSAVVDDGDGLVDLGLSVKWASCNLGATKPEEFGDYYAWGETEVKDLYNWTTYKWGSAKDKLTKYCTKDEYWDGTGAADDKSTLDIEDDAARQILGGKWRIPSAKEWAELHRNCVWLYTKLNGVEGYKVTSNVSGYKDKWIFLPIGGFLGGNGLVHEDKCYYWSSTLYGSEPNLVYYLYTYYVKNEIYDDGKANRCSGLCIRPVSE